MQVDWWTLALQTVNFLVLVWLLYRFLYKPVQRIVEERKRETELALAEAEAARLKAIDEAAGYQAKTVALAEEREKLIRDARAQIELDRQEILAEARRQAEALANSERDALLTERSEALKDLQNGAATLAVTLAKKLLQDTPQESAHDEFIRRIDERLSAMTDWEQSSLLDVHSRRGTVEIITASSLTKAQQEKWKQMLAERLGTECEVRFSCDEELIRGVRVRFSRATIEASWASMLRQTEELLTSDEPVK